MTSLVATCVRMQMQALRSSTAARLGHMHVCALQLAEPQAAWQVPPQQAPSPRSAPPCRSLLVALEGADPLGASPVVPATLELQLLQRGRAAAPAMGAGAGAAGLQVPLFEPPLSLQRYTLVADVAAQSGARCLVDLGGWPGRLLLPGRALQGRPPCRPPVLPHTHTHTHKHHAPLIPPTSSPTPGAPLTPSPYLRLQAAGRGGC
jgi:hypothetical protein